MPREFFWQNTSRADCLHYIDLLAQKRIADAKAIEDSGLVSDATYETETAGPDRNFVTVNPERLLAMLRGEEVLEVPIDSRIRFHPGKKRYTSNDLDAAIFDDAVTDAYYTRIRKMVGEGRPIFVVSMPDEKHTLEKYGHRLVDAKMHSGMNLDVACEEAGVGEDTIQIPVAPAPVAEVVVASIQHGTHMETVTLITGNNQTPYFVRRLLRDQLLLWSGTAFKAEGPWTEYHKDTARLTALGIDP